MDTVTDAIYQLTITDENGDAVTSHPTEEAAQSALYDYVFLRWDDAFKDLHTGDTTVMPDDPADAIRQYFEMVEKHGDQFSIAIPMVTEPAETPACRPWSRWQEVDGKIAWFTGPEHGWIMLDLDEAQARMEAGRAAWLESAAIAHAERWAARYPVGWPQKHRPTLDVVRQRGLIWTWYRTAGHGPDRPKGSFVIDYPDGTVSVFLNLDELAMIMGTTAQKKTPVRSSRTTNHAVDAVEKHVHETVLAIARRLLAAVQAREVDLSLIAEAESVLAHP